MGRQQRTAQIYIHLQSRLPVLLLRVNLHQHAVQGLMEQIDRRTSPEQVDRPLRAAFGQSESCQFLKRLEEEVLPPLALSLRPDVREILEQWSRIERDGPLQRLGVMARHRAIKREQIHLLLGGIEPQG